jgi:uncharacterized protein YkwD
MSVENYLRSATNISPRTGESRYRGIVKDADPARYYRLRLNQRSSLNLALTGLQSDADLALINSNGKTIGKSVRSGQSRESIAQTVGSGTYYVRVSPQQGTTRYQLRIGVDTAQQSATSTPDQASTGNSLIDQVLALVNIQRSQAGLKPVKLNSALTASAQAHTQDMAFNDFFGHRGSNGSTSDQRALAAGYNYLSVGENIAAGFSTPETVVQAWMDSPSHRENILHSSVEDMGIGFYFLENDPGSTNYRYYWTQDFGKPLF